jgi:Zn-dependent protease with chaperone function
VTAAASPQRRRPLAGLRTPPWLWVWLVYLLAELPPAITSFYPSFAEISGTRMPAALGGTGFIMVARLVSIFVGVLYVMLVAGLAAVVFPQLRGRWVERRFRLASDDRPVIAEMQWFVDCYDPSVRLRVSLRADQMARIYPVGWRTARIAVFRPLTVLWRRDREAAQAVLLHELAHRRQGDQLITGLGSPFVWLIRIGVPAYIVLVVIPVALFLAGGGGLMAPFTASLTATVAGFIPSFVFLPVVALWLAELDADQQAAQAVGPGALRRALQAGAGPRGHLAARVMALLSHPPQRLRMRRAAARPAASVALMTAWPVSMAVFVLVFPFVLDAPLLSSQYMSLGTWDKVGLHTELGYDMPIVIATAVVLLAWPALAGLWGRLWSPGPRPGGGQPWWPSLAATALPLGVLLLFLASPPLSQQAIARAGPPVSLPGNCSPAARWFFTDGTAGDDVGTVFYQVAEAEGSRPAMAAAVQRVDAAIQAALRNPPPGTARSVYIMSMTEYRAAAQDFADGNTTAAANEELDASRLYAQAIDLVGAVASQIQNSAGCDLSGN